MTTDVHQQRLRGRNDYRRSFERDGRKCGGCGVLLWPSESVGNARPGGGYERVDVCLQCAVNGPPRRPETAS